MNACRQLWTSIDSRTHAVRLRLCIAGLQAELNDRTGAAAEIRAAEVAANELGSGKLLQQCRALQAKLAS